MTACAITISNPLGLHARAAARFVHTASGFEARILVERGERQIDGKSIMGLLLLAAGQGTVITIKADGADEDEAMNALCALVQRGFDEALDDARGRPLDDARGRPLDDARGKPLDDDRGEPIEGARD
jgi:phosphocarrier protein HPr